MVCEKKAYVLCGSRRSTGTVLTPRITGASLISSLMTAPTLSYSCQQQHSSQHTSPSTLINTANHRRRLHGGDGSDRPTSKTLWGRCPQVAPQEFCYISFRHSKMGQCLHVGVWFNPVAIKLNNLANILCTMYRLIHSVISEVGYIEEGRHVGKEEEQRVGEGEEKSRPTVISKGRRVCCKCHLISLLLVSYDGLRFKSFQISRGQLNSKPFPL